MHYPKIICAFCRSEKDQVACIFCWTCAPVLIFIYKICQSIQGLRHAHLQCIALCAHLNWHKS